MHLTILICTQLTPFDSFCRPGGALLNSSKDDAPDSVAAVLLTKLPGGRFGRDHGANTSES